MTDSPATSCMLLTPPGPGAIAVIRVSGQTATKVVNTLFQPRIRRPKLSNDTSRLSFGCVNMDGETLDDAVVGRGVVDGVPFVDLCTHGGVRIVERTLTALTERGASFREMLGNHGRPQSPARTATIQNDSSPRCEIGHPSIWLTRNMIEREAIAALGQALTARAVRFLAFQYNHLCDALQQLALCCISDPARAAAELDQLITGYKCTQSLIHGISIAIVGPPNVGKSTLFNQLVGNSAVIASPTAGTTRDWVTREIELLGTPVTLIDTAGVRSDPGPLEQDAIHAGLIAAADADLCLLVLDGSTAPPTARDATELFRRRGSSVLVAINKNDMPTQWRRTDIDAWSQWAKATVLFVSAVKGDGIPELIRSMLAACESEPNLVLGPALFVQRQWALACEIRPLVVEEPQQARQRIEQELIGPCTPNQDRGSFDFGVVEG